jgi:DNA-binding transcriptional ArsR family regulator
MPTDAARSRELKALSHPLRVRILELLDERGAASPSQLAEELGHPLGQVVYHVRRLAQLDYVELVEERMHSGAVEHFYRRTGELHVGKGELRLLSPQKRQAISGAVLEDTWRDVVAAFASGAFDRRTDRHLSHTRLMLDEQAWQQLAARLDEVLEEAHELAAESLQRVHDGAGAEALSPCRLVMLHFPVDERAEAADG